MKRSLSSRILLAWFSLSSLGSFGCSSDTEHGPRLPPAGDSGGFDAARPDGAASDSATDAGDSSLSLHALTEWAGPTVWASLDRTIAVDESENVFVSDGANVYRVVDGKPEVYLTGVEIKAVLGTDPSGLKLDVSPTSKLYIFDGNSAGTMLVSTAPHDVKLHRRLVHDVTLGGPVFPDYMQVVDDERFAFIAREGMYLSTPTSLKIVYDKAAVGGGPISCANEFLAVTREEFAFYLQGCNGSPLRGGKLDSSGLGELMDLDTFRKSDPKLSNFAGIGRDRTGGIIANLESRLFRFDTKGTWVTVGTTPSLEDFATTKGDSGLFDHRPLVMGPSGAIYIATGKSVLKVAP